MIKRTGRENAKLSGRGEFKDVLFDQTVLLVFLSNVGAVIVTTSRVGRIKKRKRLPPKLHRRE